MELREERGMPKLCQEYGISDGEHAEMPFQHVRTYVEGVLM